MPEETAQSLTYGEKAVGLTFNPSGDEQVDKAKKLYAEIIDLCANMRTPQSDNQVENERNRLLSVAITQAQQAQMWLVKAITWK